MSYCVLGFCSINRTDPYLYKPVVWLQTRQQLGRVGMASSVAVQVGLVVARQMQPSR